MEIPFLSSFIEGLKLFLASKRLKWLTLVFLVGAVTITIWETLAAMFPILAPIALFSGGVFPVFFMLTAFLSMVGLQRFIASDESYAKSLFLTLIWMVVSFVSLIILWFIFTGLAVFIFIIVAFLGWISFQSYFSTRNAVGYAEGVNIDHRSKLSTLLFWGANVFNYVIIVGAFIVSWFILFPQPPSVAVGWALLGMLLALGFNFLNGLIVTWVRNKSYAENIVLLGTFISLYSAYFIYNVLKPFDPSIDIVSIGITVFFILYTMSSVGKTLASRAEKDTRFKISKELAATFTFFLATGFMFVDAMFTTIISHPNLGTAIDTSLAGSAGDAVKLLMFPFVALLMEIRYIIRARRVTKKPAEPALPVDPLEAEPATLEPEEPTVLAETPEVDEPAPTFEEPVEEIPETDEEPISEDDDIPEFE